jgi:hypothetical protein
VAQTNDGGLGGENSPVVTTVVGIEEFPEGVTTFVSIAVCNTVWRSSNWIGMMKGAKKLVFGVSNRPRVFASRSKTVDSSECCLGTIACNLVASKDPCWSSFCLNGGGGGSSITGGRPRILRDCQSS